MYYEFVLFDNFIMDVLLLSFAARLTETKLLFYRKIWSALLGAVYAVSVLFCPFLQNFFCKTVASLLICMTACFGKKNKGFYHFVIAFYFVSLLFAGIALYLAEKHIRYHYLIMAAAILYAFLCYADKKKLSQDKYYLLKIEYEGKVIEAYGFIDTGNKLCDAKGKAVILLERSLFQGETDRLPLVFHCETVSGNAILYGFKPKKLLLQRDDGKWISLTNAVALASIGNTSYSAILPAQINAFGIIFKG
ncbi:MAG: sigma-E processing peptidase SpoIIGA [Christensenellaceae bacterium]|nr:sigma-E processing peptidase SpoIIGA [Christensenellaceae bacterium]